MSKFITMITLLLMMTPTLSLAAHYNLPLDSSDVVGEIQTLTVTEAQSLASIGLEYGIGLHEMAEANPYINPRQVKVGEQLIIPSQFILPSLREGIVINLAELRLYYFPSNAQEVYTFPLAIGRVGWRTPIAKTRVIAKSKDPVWHVPKSIRKHAWITKRKILPAKVMPGPKNPLGKFALHLNVPGYLIHGTNAPSSIGKRVSSGCMRMSAPDIESLYHMVAVNTPVHIINEPYKVGYKGQTLYLEAHQPLSDAVHVATYDHLVTVVTAAAANNDVDWSVAEQVAEEKLGMPTVVQKQALIW